MSFSFSNLTLEINFQFRKLKNYTQLLDMKDVALTVFCILPKTAAQKV